MIAMIIGVTVTPAFAQVSPGQAQQDSSVSPVPTKALRLPNGMVVSESWTKSTSAALPKLPRGLRYASEVLSVKVRNVPSAQVVQSRAIRSSVITPDTGSGCTPFLSPRTCIYVNGSGLRVNYWTTAVNINSGTTYPTSFYEINGLVREYIGFELEGSGGFFTDPIGYQQTYLEYISGERDDYLIFGNNTKVCNFWTGAAVSTLPCLTVHS